MNLEFFIAKRISEKGKKKRRFTGTINGIAVTGIGLSVAVMLIAVNIVTGFKQEIRNKVIGFGSHIQLLNYDSNLSYQTEPIPKNPEFLIELKEVPGISHIQPFAIKAGIVKTEADIQGLVLKGIDDRFDWSFFEKNLIEGETFEVYDSAYTSRILISSFLASKMQLKTGDSFQMWFVDKSPRFRKFTVSGIYETSLAEFDETFAIADIKHIQRLNNWEVNQVSGLEININKFGNIEEITREAREITAGYMFDDGARIRVQNIIERYPQIFDWMELQDLNVMIIIILMLVVAGFNMISGLLILILDRTYMIGVLKAMGGKNLMIRKIFLYQASFLILKGLFWGNLLGIGLSYIQKKYEIISLDPVNYYLTTVPINLDVINVILINFGAMAAIMAFLVLPSLLVARISPAKVIRFE
ncbi:MAG: ABC transporter permease [Bacteroidales bacterium]